MIRYIKSPNLTYPQPTGISLNDPIGWTDVVTESNTYSTSNDSANLWRYFAIKLNAGTKYTIKQTQRSFDTAFWLYNIDKSVITSVDSDSPSSPSSDGRIDGDSTNETFYYTPSVTGIYYLCWGAYSNATGNATIEITPRPENYTMLSSVLIPSIGIDKWGFPIEYSSVHLSKIDVKSNNLVTPDNMSSDTSEDWVITSTGNYSDRYVWKAFDGNSDTWFDGRGSENPRFFGWQYLKGKTKINSYILYNKGIGATEDNLGEWILQGSNDGSSWDDLHHVGADEVYTNWTTTPEVFTPTTSGFYSHYRINCLKNSLGTTKREFLPYITEFKAYGAFKNN